MQTMSANASVGIITRTKNRPALLKRALESVLGQTYQNWTMVIVNDGGDPTLVDKLVSYYSDQAQERVRVIHNDRSLGMEAASNIGLRSIATDYIVIHDDDDSWAPEFLTIAVAELNQAHAKYSQIKGVITKANTVNERIDGNVVVIEDVEPFMPWMKEGLVSLDTMLVDNQFAPIQFLYKHEVLHEIGYYREDLPVLGDWEFNIRFLLRYDINIVPQYLAFYHHRRSDLHSAYGNSIISGVNRHLFTRQLLENEWLRNDITSGTSGLGTAGKIMTLQQIAHRHAAAIDRIERHIEKSTHEHVKEYAKGYANPLQNVALFAKLWMKSGRPIHYVKRFFESLFSKGLGETIRTVKLWISAKKSLLA